MRQWVLKRVTGRQKVHDETYVNSFIDTIKVAAKFKSVLRLGKPGPAKKKPVMVIFHSEEEKEKIMSPTNLKVTENYKGVSITEDYILKD